MAKHFIKNRRLNLKWDIGIGANPDVVEKSRRRSSNYIPPYAIHWQNRTTNADKAAWGAIKKASSDIEEQTARSNRISNIGFGLSMAILLLLSLTVAWVCLKP